MNRTAVWFGGFTFWSRLFKNMGFLHESFSPSDLLRTLTLVTWFWPFPVEHFVCLTFSLGSVLGLSGWSLLALLVSVWVPSRCSDLLPQSRDFQITLIGDSEITRWWECECKFLFFCPITSTVMNWWFVQSVPSLSPNVKAKASDGW